MKIIINGVYEGFPVAVTAETPLASLPGLIQQMLDVGMRPPESLSEFVKQVDARDVSKTANPEPTTDQREMTTSGAPACPVHQTAMRPGNKGGYFCARKNPNGEWCDQRITQKQTARTGSQPKQQSFVTDAPLNQHGF